MPKFVIDEDMPRSTSKVLQECNYEVKDIRDYGLRGSDDVQIYKFAQDNQSVLVSGDMGFSNILHYPIGSHLGIVIAHFPNEMSTYEMNRQIVNRVKELAEEDFTGNLIIIEPGRIRIRKKLLK